MKIRATGSKVVRHQPRNHGLSDTVVSSAISAIYELSIKMFWGRKSGVWLRIGWRQIYYNYRIDQGAFPRQ